MRHVCTLIQILKTKLTISRGNITHIYCFGEWGMENSTTAFGNSLAVSYKLIIHLSYDQGNPTTLYLHNRNENLCSCKHLK